MRNNVVYKITVMSTCSKRQLQRSNSSRAVVVCLKREIRKKTNTPAAGIDLSWTSVIQFDKRSNIRSPSEQTEKDLYRGSFILVGKSINRTNSGQTVSQSNTSPENRLVK